MLTSGMCLLTNRIIRKFGYIFLIAMSYLCFCIFLSAHLSPTLYVLLPAYLLFGLTLGPAWLTKLWLAVSLASKLSCSQPECGGSSTAGAMADSYDDHKLVCNRDETVRRFGRWYHAAQDVGIIIGAITASFVLSCASTSIQFGCSNGNSNHVMQNDTANDQMNSQHLKTNLGNTPESNSMKTLMSVNGTAATPSSAGFSTAKTADAKNNNFQYQDLIDNTHKHNQDSEEQQPEQLFDINYVYDIFEINDYGERICGANSCPVWWKFNYDNNNNGGGGYGGGISRKNHTILTTILTTNDNSTYNYGAVPLMCIYLVFGIIALTLTCFLNDIDSIAKIEILHSKSLTDTILFAGPLAFFIGTEQGYMLADFTKVSVYVNL